MIPLDPRQTGGLSWVQHSMWKRHWELRAGDALLAELQFNSPFGSLATATAAGAAWTFKRTGFFSPVVTARAVGQEADVATYQPSWPQHRGRLFIGADELELRSANFWGTRYALAAAGQELLSFENTGTMHHGANVIVHEAARNRADLPLLLTLCWYLLVLYMEDSSSVAAVTASTVACTV